MHARLILDNLVPVVLVLTRDEWEQVLDSEAELHLEHGCEPVHADIFRSCYEQVYGGGHSCL